MENYLNYLTKYNPNIEKIFSKSLKHTLNVLYKISLERDTKVYLVGGIVRDIFLGRNSSDIDIVIEGNSQEFAKYILPEVAVSKHRYTERFLTYNIFTKAGTNIDIASFRSEVYEYPGALPVVTPTSIEKDFIRRDFSINAMYISFDKRAELYDPLNALSDTKNKVIRIIHDKSFEDDPTRIFRAVKFAARYNFSFEENTKNLLLEAMEKNYLSSISNLRIKNEIYMLLSEKNLIGILTLLRDYKIFSFLGIPNPSDKDIEDINDIVKKYTFKKMKEEHKISKGNFILMYLIRNLSSSEKKEALKVFEMSEKNLSSIIFEEGEEEKITENLKEAYKPSHIYSALNKVSPFKILYLLYIVRKNRKKIKSYIFDLNNKNAIISGSDLIDAGFKKDVSLKKYIEKCFFIQLDMKNPTKEKILSELAKELNKNGEIF